MTGLQRDADAGGLLVPRRPPKPASRSVPAKAACRRTKVERGEASVVELAAGVPWPLLAARANRGSPTPGSDADHATQRQRQSRLEACRPPNDEVCRWCGVMAMTLEAWRWWGTQSKLAAISPCDPLEEGQQANRARR